MLPRVAGCRASLEGSSPSRPVAGAEALARSHASRGNSQDARPPASARGPVLPARFCSPATATATARFPGAPGQCHVLCPTGNVPFRSGQGCPSASRFRCWTPKGRLCVQSRLSEAELGLHLDVGRAAGHRALASTSGLGWASTLHFPSANSAGGRVVNTNCSALRTRQALCCKMSVEYDKFIESGRK